jgi:hypothetical protein
MANSLLLLSQTQAQSALALKRVVKLRPGALSSLRKSNTTQKDRLRERVRGALDKTTEADLSDSAFLGKTTAAGGPQYQQQQTKPVAAAAAAAAPKDAIAKAHTENPVDEMMELERELRDMDMALELGNSIASLDARTQNRMKLSVTDGSFMVVPPGSANSYMSSSSMWSPRISTAAPATTTTAGTAGVRARANRVQNILEASTPRPTAAHHHHHHHQPPQQLPAKHYPPPQPPSQQQQQHDLSSSWWGTSSTASQVLTSSVISLASHGGDQHAQQQPANTKQLMRLMDSLRTLGEENASLLRELEGAEAARQEAKAARKQMARFKEEYRQRFAKLKEALEKFRKESSESNPVANSEYLRNATTSDQLERKDQLIRKLTDDLKKEKEESRKKDSALRRYESFYREVKARSAQKQRQRSQQQQQQQQQRHKSVPNARVGSR